jgi:hypothetical protein
MGALDIPRLRLLNQKLDRTDLRDPADVVRELGAVQAQDYLGSLWALGIRTRGATEMSVERAIADRTIVRTWPMRGTLHFVPAEDACWMIELLAPRVMASSAGRYRQLGLNDGVFARSGEIVVRALEGGRRLTRPALYKALEAEGIATEGSRALHILGHLAMQALVCAGPREGKQATVVLLEEWVPAPRRLTRDEALAELTRRYVTSHGPATAHDFAWWSGLTLREVQAGLEACPELERESIEGRTWWFKPPGRVRRRSGAGAWLLPPFDEYTVAYRDRSAVVEARFAAQASAGGMLHPLVVIDGHVRGTWRRTLATRSVRVSVKPFSRLVKAEWEAVAVAAERYGRFLGAPVTVARVDY